MHGDLMYKVVMCQIKIKQKLGLINNLYGLDLDHLPWNGFWNSKNHYVKEVPEGKQYKIISKYIEKRYIQILDSINQGDLAKRIIINSIDRLTELLNLLQSNS